MIYNKYFNYQPKFIDLFTACVFLAVDLLTKRETTTRHVYNVYNISKYQHLTHAQHCFVVNQDNPNIVTATRFKGHHLKIACPRYATTTTTSVCIFVHLMSKAYFN